MHRLRMMHTFLWYLIYGHPLQHNCSSSDSTSQSSSGADGSDPAAKPADSKAQQDLKEAESSTPADRLTPLSDSVGTGCDGRKSADSSLSNMEVASGDEGEEQKDSCSQSDMKGERASCILALLMKMSFGLLVSVYRGVEVLHFSQLMSLVHLFYFLCDADSLSR